MDLLSVLIELWEFCMDEKYDATVLSENGEHYVSVERLEAKLWKMICRLEKQKEEK